MNAESEPGESTFGDLWPDLLATTRFERFQWIEETGSTNADLAELAATGAPEQLLATDFQSAGRGRRDRSWEAPAESGTLMSFLIRDERGISPFWAIGSVALAAAAAISLRTATPCRLKWPNDLLLGEHEAEGKVAGILSQGSAGAVVVGIGINTNWAGQRPDGVPAHATAVDEHMRDDGASTTIDRRSLVRDIVVRLDELLELEVAELRRRWIDGCATIGRAVRAERETSDPIVGTAVDVAMDGALVIDVGGSREAVYVGDVVHLRPA